MFKFRLFQILPIPALFISACISADIKTPAPSKTAAQTALPNLSIASVYVEMQNRTGTCVSGYSPYEVRVVVKNDGNANAAPFVVDVNGVRQTVNNGVPVNASVTLRFPLPSNGLSAMVVDADNQIPEWNENDNAYTFIAPTPTPPPLCPPTP